MFCSKCGNQLNDGAVFCPKCGSPVKDEGKFQNVSQTKVMVGAPVKKNIKVWIVIAIIAVVLFGIIIMVKSCGKSSSQVKPELGKPFYFGRYPQSSSSDQPEDILWDVVAENNGNYMLLSHYVLDCQPYSGYALWLNNDFMTAAFNDEELERFAGDSVTLLSLDDIETLMNPEHMDYSSTRLGYILSSGKIACPATDYAKSMGVKTVTIDELTDGHSKYNASLFSSVQNDIGSDAKNNIAEYWLLRDPYSDTENFGVTCTYAGDVYNIDTRGGIRPVIWIKGEKNSDAAKTSLTNYDKYIGEWDCVGDIGHPDGGVLVRYGHEMVISEKGIDCTDLFGRDSRSNFENLEYYNDNGNDYYVDFTGDPIGFYYDNSVNQMIIYTPSKNYPSDNPLEWNDRIRLERK